MVSKSDFLNVRISPELKASVEEQAAEEGRTVSNYVIRVLEKEMEAIRGAKSQKTAKKRP